MKLIVMIPALNEEDSLPIAYADIPKNIHGVNEIETLLINDGSTDKTVQVAKNLGVNHILSFKRNRGLAKVFNLGLKEAIKLGADIVITFDADNQYSGKSVKALIEPILNQSADIVVGARPIQNIKHFSFLKKKLQKLGSRVVDYFSGITIPDVTSGFRAYNREAALRLVVVSDFTYTLETIIEAREKGLAVTSVPIEVNDKVLRKSRLFKGNFQYIKRQTATIFRIYFMYNLFRVLQKMGKLFFAIASIISVRFMYYFYITPAGQNAGHIQSLILAAILFILGMFMVISSYIADLVHHNRKIAEENLYYLRKNEFKK